MQELWCSREPSGKSPGSPTRKSWHESMTSWLCSSQIMPKTRPVASTTLGAPRGDPQPDYISGNSSTGVNLVQWTEDIGETAASAQLAAACRRRDRRNTCGRVRMHYQSRASRESVVNRQPCCGNWRRWTTRKQASKSFVFRQPPGFNPPEVPAAWPHKARSERIRLALLNDHWRLSSPSRMIQGDTSPLRTGEQHPERTNKKTVLIPETIQ